MIVTILHFVLAVLLFFIVNWIGKHSSGYGYLQLTLFVRSDQAPAFNFILKTFTPSIFIILIGASCYALHWDKVVFGIWSVAAYYFAFRLAYNLVLGRLLLLNWASVFAQSIVGIASAYLVYRHLVLPKRPLFPDINTIGNQLWIVVALFIYAAFNSLRTDGEASAKRKNSYLRSRFRSLHALYDDLIKGEFPERYMELVGYAIMVHETFNRPWIVQKLEGVVFPRWSETIGPMQVRTSVRLSDRESVELGIRILKGHFETTLGELQGKKLTQYEVIHSTLAKYNRDADYIREVSELLHSLWAQVATEYRTEFEHMYRQR